MTIEQKVASLYGSAEDVRHIANLAHSVPGSVFILVAILLLLAGFGYKKKELGYAYSGILFSFSIIFTSYIFFSKGAQHILTMAEIIWHYPEIGIHLIQALAAIAGSFIELLYLRRLIKNKLAVLAFPTLFIIIGYTNILHPHGPIHDENHMIFHSLLGAIMVLAGIFLIISRLLNDKYSRVFLVLSVSSILVFSSMLILYKEAPNAYEYAFPVKMAVKTGTYIDVGNNGTIYIYTDHVAPQDIKIKAGGIIKFVQVDGSWHDIASGPHPTHTEYPPLNIGILKQGETHEVVFPKAGNFGFHDHIHDEDTKLQGKILVY